MKRTICLILAILTVFSLCACGRAGGDFGVKNIQTLENQEYYIAFRNNDPVYYYVVGALQVLTAEGKVGELSAKWLGSTNAVDFGSDATALDNLPTPDNRTLLLGVDTDSFPFVYISNGTFWGFDIELAQAVCDRLGWTLKAMSIKKENVYQELASGNVDCCWGGLAMDDKEIDKGDYTVYGPYIKNEICIAARSSSMISSLKGRSMAMPSTTEAMEALQNEKNLVKQLSNVYRLQGGTPECFEYLYAGQADTVLTDSTALLYFNCH